MPMTIQPDLNLGELVAQHQTGVWWYLRFLGADDATADDLTQDTFLAFLRWPPDLRDPDAVGGYLRTVARNALFRAHRRRQIPSARTRDELQQLAEAWDLLHPPCQDADREFGTHSDGMLAALADCVERLPDATRRLVTLKYEQDLTSAEMARETGLGESNVRVTLHRALRQLHDCVTGKMQREARP